jgi:TATA element modulatory factor
MATPGKSRWGSLLSQAVAGIEARLDDVLADKEEPGKEPKPAAAISPGSSISASPAKPSQTPGKLCIVLQCKVNAR